MRSLLTELMASVSAFFSRLAGLISGTRIRAMSVSPDALKHLSGITKEGSAQTSFPIVSWKPPEMSQYFPRIKRKTCDPIDYTDICPGRRQASMDGTFWYDEKRGGYCCSELLGPLNIPILLDACPYCRSLIPGRQARRAWDKQLGRQADGSDSGEGWE